MIVTAPLDTDEVVESEFITESETYLREHGYNIDTAAYHLCVNQKPESENTGYIVKTIETTKVPFAQADVVEDTYRMHICSCKSYRYQNGLPDLEKENVTAYSPCKHCVACDPTLKAKTDEKQEQLL